jgi:glucose 1-dehydrogenase
MQIRPLEGRTAVVTGAGKGIGTGIARALAAAGAAVLVNYSNSEEGAAAARDEITAKGGKAEIFKADVSKEEEVLAMMKAAFDWTGRLDILVNNAALQVNLPFKLYKMETYDRIIEVNLTGYFLCTREAAKYMIKARSGVILYNSSVHAKRPTEFDPAYCMTKGGIKMLEREAAVELSQYGIRVLCIEPGGVPLEKPKSGSEGVLMSSRNYTQERLFRFRNGAHLGRAMHPADVGKMVAALASDDFDLLNGCEIQMDEGDTLF